MRRALSLAAPLLLICLLMGCGSSNSTGTSTNTPTPGGATTPGTNPSTAPDSFLATIYDTVSRTPAAVGQITLDTEANNGVGHLQVASAGVGSNQGMVLRFCPYPKAATGCFNVVSFTSDATGSASVNFTFPQKGTFAGLFIVVLNSGDQIMAGSTGSTGTNFRSALLPAGTVTGGIDQATGNAPGSGSVVVNNTTAHIVLGATTANHTFSAAVCGIFPQNACTTLTNVTTDAQGNANMDVGTVPPDQASTFRLSDSAGVEFVSAFRVQ